MLGIRSSVGGALGFGVSVGGGLRLGYDFRDQG